MKISPNVEALGIDSSRKTTEIAPKKTPKLSFEGVLKESKNSDPYTELLKLREGLAAGKTFTPHELLRYQITASNFGLRVELVSKLADGLLTTVKKLQSQ